MNTDQALQALKSIKQYYDAVKYPKYRNLDLPAFKARYERLATLKPQLESNVVYNRLVNAMSQVISKVEEQQRYIEAPAGETWSNLSERGMNKVIPPIDKRKVGQFPVQWTDKWGNDCFVSKGYWTAKNYRVMDALGYMLLLKEGGDRLPEEHYPIFDDLMDIEARENQLNGSGAGLSTVRRRSTISPSNGEIPSFPSNNKIVTSASAMAWCTWKRISSAKSSPVVNPPVSTRVNSNSFQHASP